MSHPQTLRARALKLLTEGSTSPKVAALLGVPTSTVPLWRRRAGLTTRKSRKPVDLTADHRLVLVAVHAGDRCAAHVWRRCRLTLEGVEVERLAYDLARWGLLCALDGEPWSLTEAGVQALLGPAVYAEWAARTPVRARLG